jgi:hypothetical protein
MPVLYLYTVVYFANVGKTIKSFTMYRWMYVEYSVVFIPFEKSWVGVEFSWYTRGTCIVKIWCILRWSLLLVVLYLQCDWMLLEEIRSIYVGFMYQALVRFSSSYR